jgi:hypothetical protein
MTAAGRVRVVVGCRSITGGLVRPQDRRVDVTAALTSTLPR